MSPPAASTFSTSSPSRAKSAESMEGAIKSRSGMMQSAWSKDGTVAHLDANFSAVGPRACRTRSCLRTIPLHIRSRRKFGAYRFWIARVGRSHLGRRYVFRLCSTEACGSAVIGAVLAHAALEKRLRPLFPLGMGDSPDSAGNRLLDDLPLLGRSAPSGN